MSSIGSIGNISVYQFPDVSTLRSRIPEVIRRTPQERIEHVKQAVEDLRLRNPISDLVPASAAESMPSRLMVKGPSLYEVTGHLAPRSFEPLIDTFA